MAAIIVIGAILSLVALVVLSVLLRDVFRRRERFPPVTYGSCDIPQRTLAWFWAGVLVLGFVVSLNSGHEFLSQSHMQTTPPEDTDWSWKSSWSVSVPLPFLKYTIVESRGVEGERVRVSDARLRIPIVFLLAIGLYWFAVVRYGRRRSA